MNPALLRMLLLLATAPATVSRSAPVGVAAESTAPAEFMAARIHAVLRAALAASDAAGESRGSRLADYAAVPAGDPECHESTREAARRIVAETPAERQAPDRTAAWLLAAGQELQSSLAGHSASARGRELLATAHLARFHGLRLIAAVRYNLFRRALNLSELYACIRQEQLAVAAWRDLASIAGDDTQAQARRAELARLEENLRDLEALCCPPRPEVAAGAVWRPRPE